MNARFVIVISDCYHRNYVPGGSDEWLGNKPFFEIVLEKALMLTDKKYILVSSFARSLLEYADCSGVRTVHVDPAVCQELVFLPPDAPHFVSTLARVFPGDTRVVILSTLCPFLETSTIQSAIDRSLKEDPGALISISNARDHPLRALELKDGSLKCWYKDAHKYPRRQDFPPVYEPNNAVQIFKKANWKNYDDLVLESKAIGFLTKGLDAFSIESRLDLLLAKKIFEIMQARGIRTNEDFTRFLHSEEAFAMHDAKQ